MKIILTRETGILGDESFQVTVLREGFPIDCHTFDTKKEVNAFYSGFQSARLAANALIQSLPMELVERR